MDINLHFQLSTYLPKYKYLNPKIFSHKKVYLNFWKEVWKLIWLESENFTQIPKTK